MLNTNLFQLKPVRSLENFKTSSPTSSPERWMYPTQRSSAPMVTPPTRLFLSTIPKVSQETQNLLQSPDDIFSSPPVPPRPPKSRADFFGNTPFIVGGGHSENGHPVFLVANQHTIDVVRLSPPVISSPRRKVNLCVCMLMLCTLFLLDIKVFGKYINVLLQ